SGSPGRLPSEEGRGFFQDVALLAQDAHLFAQLAQLLALGSGQTLALTCVDLRLREPAVDRRLGQIQVSTDLRDGLARAADERDRLRLELLAEHTPGLVRWVHTDSLLEGAPLIMGVHQFGSRPRACGPRQSP